MLLGTREYHSGAYLTHLNDSGGSLSGYGYDTFGRIKNHRWKDSSGTLLAGWSHDYDRVGNKLYQEDLEDATESELYGYDGVYRLTSFERGQLNANKDDITSPTRSQTWTLDPLGNWDDTTIDSATETRTHNSVNELTARTPSGGSQIDLTYDDAGNLTQDGDSDGDHKYAWDYRNRLIEVQEKQSGTWTTIAEYTYDAKNRRVVKEVTNKGDLNGTMRFIWGGSSQWQCLEERDSSGDLVARFTYSPGYIDAVARQERDLNSDDDFGDTNEVVWYHSNTLYSIYALTDASENVVERYRYDAYGAATVLDADGSDDSDGISDVDNPYAFTARRLDLESDLMYYRNRQYSVALGRFISRDPAEYADSDNLYLYVQGLPTGGADPRGSVALKDIKDTARHGRRVATLSMARDAEADLGSQVNIRVPVAHGADVCSHWGYVQIVRTDKVHAKTGRWQGWRPWEIDGDTPSNWPVYQGEVYEVGWDSMDLKPNESRIEWIGTLYDRPGFDRFLPMHSKYTVVGQQFETCLVCLDCKLSCYSRVFGCMRWGHSFIHIGNGQWVEIRYGGGLKPKVQSKGHGVSLTIPGDDMVRLGRPSSTWRDLVWEPLCGLWQQRCG